MTPKSRGAGPRVTWAGVVVKLDDGRTVALEFDGATSFVTADVHTVKPWDQLSTNKFQDEARVVIQGNGRVWTEGAGYGPTQAPRALTQEEQKALPFGDPNKCYCGPEDPRGHEPGVPPWCTVFEGEVVD